MSKADAPISRAATVGVYRFPTSAPESDGTLTWDATTAVTVALSAAGRQGLGWTYSTAAAAPLITDHLIPTVAGLDATDTQRCWEAMHRACRNLGTKGLVMQAISAVDIALWDLKATVLGVPLSTLLGSVRVSVPAYGSGGFTNLREAELAEQIDQWRRAGCTAMKIKIGERWGGHVERDLRRVEQLADQAGPGVELMVDANGGYTRGQARRVGRRLDEFGVRWFEEPVSSDDLAGLAQLRDVLDCDVAAGEYVSESTEAERLCRVVDCLQLDVTRCGGYTGFLRGAAIAHAAQLDVSAHCAPSLHAFVAAAVPNLRHVEWFADHARLEPVLFDGIPAIRDGSLWPNIRETGHGMTIAGQAAAYAR